MQQAKVKAAERRCHACGKTFMGRNSYALKNHVCNEAGMQRVERDAAMAAQREARR